MTGFILLPVDTDEYIEIFIRNADSTNTITVELAKISMTAIRLI